MKIACFNKLPSSINLMNEALSLYPNTLLSEHLVIASALSIEFIPYNDIDIFSDKEVIEMLSHFFCKHKEYVISLQKSKEMLKENNKYLKQKNKDKLTLKIISLNRKMSRDLRVRLKEQYSKRLKHFKVLELVNFEKESNWELVWALYSHDEKREDHYIPVLTETILEQEYIMSFDGIVEEIFTFTELDSIENTGFDYIKIPLWDFPMFDGITFLEMKHTCEDIKQALQSYNVMLDELMAKLFKIPFTTENQIEIKHLCTDNITPFILPIQNSINESLYLCKLKNQSDANTGSTFNLGITSAENLINYYEKSGIILPYVAAETKEQLSRKIDLKSSCLFLYNLFKNPC